MSGSEERRGSILGLLGILEMLAGAKTSESMAARSLAMKPHDPISDHPHAAKEFETFKQFFSSLQAQDVDSVLISVLHKADPGEPCLHCGKVHKSSGLTHTVGLIGNRDAAMAMMSVIVDEIEAAKDGEHDGPQTLEEAFAEFERRTR